MPRPKGFTPQWRQWQLECVRGANEAAGAALALLWEELQTARDLGCTYRQIGDVLGVSRDAVWKMLGPIQRAVLVWRPVPTGQCPTCGRS